MKKNFPILALVSFVAILSTGCYTSGDGDVKAGMPFKKDKITSRYERPASAVIPAAREAVAMYGALTGDDSVKSVIEAKINQRTVWVKIIEEEPNLTTVITQVRTKMGGTDIELAAEIDKQIALRLPR